MWEPIVWQDPSAARPGIGSGSELSDPGLASQSPLDGGAPTSRGARAPRRTFPRAPMDLLSYVRILRRRWLLIVAVTIAGLGLGAASAYASSSSSVSGGSGRYYKATNLMFLDTTANQNAQGSASSSAFINPQQDALLVTSGDVPTSVGTK